MARLRLDSNNRKINTAPLGGAGGGAGGGGGGGAGGGGGVFHRQNETYNSTRRRRVYNFRVETASGWVLWAGHVGGSRGWAGPQGVLGADLLVGGPFFSSLVITHVTPTR